MEIPIQVAVRIYPHALLHSRNVSLKFATTAKNIDANGNDGDKNINENTFNTDENREKELCLLTTSIDVNKNTNGGEEQRNCVHTIPIASSSTIDFHGVQGSTSTALPGGQLDNIATGLIQVGPHSFPVTHALPTECSQSQVYHQTVYPLISLFMEGFDASVVTYGQKATGKSYTLFGNGFDCNSEDEQGVIQRCVEEIFAHIKNHSDRTYAVNVGFVEICGEAIRDLLGMGNVHCTCVTDVFHLLQLGLSAKSDGSLSPSTTHTLFTLTLEQQWVTKEGLIQHRLSTASFSDLCATERQFILNTFEKPASVPSDAGLNMLEQVVNTLTDPSLMYGVNGNIPYGQTTLSTLLKDSFGGRAQTLVILCVSPLEKDINETICNLQFAFKVQCVRNYVIMNTFSDDNMPILPEVVPTEIGPTDVCSGIGLENFGLQFAASQWFKLVSNAEGLFAKLISSKALTNLEKEQIEEWLFLKQECEECLSSSEVLRTQKQLGPIQEADEPEESVSEPETSCHQNSDNETDTESQIFPESRMSHLMDEFKTITDNLVKNQHNEFLAKQPKAVMESQESSKHCKAKIQDSLDTDTKTDLLNERKTSVGGRRRSIQPGASLSSAEIAMLNRVASREQQQQYEFVAKVNADLGSSSENAYKESQLRAVENIQKRLRQLNTDIEARERQITEIEQTILLKENIITELVKNSETRSNAKQRFNKKKAKLEAEYEKAKKHLAKAASQGKEKSERERLRALILHIETRLEDLTSMKHIASESGQKVKKLQQSLHESKKQMEDIQKKIKKERKLRDQLDTEIKVLKEGRDCDKALVKVDSGAPYDIENEATNGRQLKEVQDRISHLDHILREKSENLEQCVAVDSRTQQNEGLRHEIRNLRRTRDHLLDQRCSLDRKLKRDKMLTHREERKLLECDEAIEAIDAAIEFKNELICGHKSIDTSEHLQREKGEQLLMARLNRLSPEEMRTLLYKYFTKVIDLRDSSRKLEVQLVQIEREREAWEWKERVLSNAVRQARLEGERNAVLLQRQHEMKLTLMLRHLAEETSASSVSFSERDQHSLLTGVNSPSTPTKTDFDYELDFYQAHKMFNKTPSIQKHLHDQNSTNDMEMCPLNNTNSLSKFKSLDKYKDKERSGGSKNIFAKFQVLTRYATAGASAAAVTQSSSTTNAEDSLVEASPKVFTAATFTSKKPKHKDEQPIAIPQENLKRLIATPSATKVTRQKNKIIIQNAVRKN